MSRKILQLRQRLFWVNIQAHYFEFYAGLSRGLFECRSPDHLHFKRIQEIRVNAENSRDSPKNCRRLLVRETRPFNIPLLKARPRGLFQFGHRQDVIDAGLELLALDGGQVALDLEHRVVRGETDLGLVLLGLGLFSDQLAGRSATSVRLGGQLLQGIQDLRHLAVMVADMEGHADGIEPALPHRPNANLVLGQVFVDFRVFDRLHFEADHRRTVGLLLG